MVPLSEFGKDGSNKRLRRLEPVGDSETKLNLTALSYDGLFFKLNYIKNSDDTKAELQEWKLIEFSSLKLVF